jgi:hypothetical protein
MPNGMAVAGMAAVAGTAVVGGMAAVGGMADTVVTMGLVLALRVQSLGLVLPQSLVA